MQIRRWGAATPPPVGPSAFEKLAARLGVKERDWPKSEPLRKWASKHRNNRYVPETLLFPRSSDRSCRVSSLWQAHASHQVLVAGIRFQLVEHRPEVGKHQVVFSILITFFQPF